MNGYLLDTNLLIALLWPSHERHELALKWFTRHRARGWVTCPFTQAGVSRRPGELMQLRVNRVVGQPALRRLGDAEVDHLGHRHAVVQRHEDVRRRRAVPWW